MTHELGIAYMLMVEVHFSIMVLRIGHRGAAGYEPENTLRSFEKAIELGVDMVELDVQRCRGVGGSEGEGALVVIHDDTLGRTTNGRGFVSFKSLRELRRLDAGKGERIPTLEEVLDCIRRRVKVNIELKGKETASFVSCVIEQYVRKYKWQYDQFLVSSFDWDELKKFRKVWGPSMVPIGVLVDPGNWMQMRDYGWFGESLRAHSINPGLKAVTQKMIDGIHYRGMKALVWTVNEPKDIARMKNMGVDGIFSDYPDRITP